MVSVWTKLVSFRNISSSNAIPYDFQNNFVSLITKLFSSRRVADFCVKKSRKKLKEVSRQEKGTRSFFILFLVKNNNNLPCATDANELHVA